MGTVRDIMTTHVQTISSNSTVAEAARLMRDNGIGDVVVVDGGQLHGIVTDRDITVRAVAEGQDATSMPVSQVASTDLTTVSPSDDADRAVTLMREKAIRRLPVVENGQPVGIISIGDLAIERDEQSALAEISAAESNT